MKQAIPYEKYHFQDFKAGFFKKSFWTSIQGLNSGPCKNPQFAVLLDINTCNMNYSFPRLNSLRQGHLASISFDDKKENCTGYIIVETWASVIVFPWIGSGPSTQLSTSFRQSSTGSKTWLPTKHHWIWIKRSFKPSIEDPDQVGSVPHNFFKNTCDNARNYYFVRVPVPLDNKISGMNLLRNCIWEAYGLLA